MKVNNYKEFCTDWFFLLLYNQLMASKTLTRKISKLQKVFDINQIKNLDIKKEYIQKYYKTNSFPYTIFHTFKGYVHMGVSRDGKFKKRDLEEAIKMVEEYVCREKSFNGLELASGRGMNLKYLAQKNPELKLYGIDLSDGQLKHAYKKVRKHNNIKVFKGDYHDLSRFKENEFDFIYVIEAFCYSNDKQKVFNEVSRVLKKDGLFVIYDGYRGSKKADADEETACIITQKGMAVENFETYGAFLNYAGLEGFQLIYDEDITNFVIPTMKRFERLASIFLNLPLINKLIVKIFPKEFTYNVMAAYLMPSLMKEGFGQFMFSVFKKNE